MWFSDKNAKGVLQHLSANHERELSRVGTTTCRRQNTSQSIKRNFFYPFSNRSASTREQENGVFEKFHFGDRLQKVPFSVTVSSFTCGRKAKSVKKKLRFQKNPDTWPTIIIPRSIYLLTRNIRKKTNSCELLNIRNLFFVIAFYNNIWNMS